MKRTTFERIFDVEKIVLFHVMLMIFFVPVHASVEEIKKYVFDNIDTKYINEQINKLQQLHVACIVPRETLLMYVENRGDHPFFVKAFVGRSHGIDAPHVNFRYENNSEATIIFDNITKYLSEQLKDPALLKKVEILHVGQAVLFGFMDEMRIIGQPASWPKAHNDYTSHIIK